MSQNPCWVIIGIRASSVLTQIRPFNRNLSLITTLYAFKDIININIRKKQTLKTSETNDKPQIWLRIRNISEGGDKIGLFCTFLVFSCFLFWLSLPTPTRLTLEDRWKMSKRKSNDNIFVLSFPCLVLLSWHRVNIGTCRKKKYNSYSRSRGNGNIVYNKCIWFPWYQHLGDKLLNYGAFTKT